VPKRLPWANNQAHVKGTVCRVPDDLTHDKENTHGKLDTFAVCLT